MAEQVWKWSDRSRGVCTLCDTSVAGPGWMEFAERDGSEKPVRLVCFHCNQEDLNKWYAERRGLQIPNGSVIEPPSQSPPPKTEASVPQPQPLQDTSRPEMSGQKIYKKVYRDPETRMITGIEEISPPSPADLRRERLADDWRGMTPEKMMRVQSYRHRQIRKRQGR